MAVLYTQLLNINNKKILTGNHSTNGAFIQEDVEVFTELKHLVAKALHSDNISTLQTNKTYSKTSENGRFVFYIGALASFDSQLCVACIADTKTTTKTISVFLDRLFSAVQDGKIKIVNINVACYQNDTVVKQLSDEFNKQERVLSTNEILESTHTSLVENLDNLIYRGESINNLKDMAHNLRQETDFMSKKVRQMRNREKFEQYKSYAVIAVILLLLFYFFFWRR